ncbi:hypothetical protein [Marivirga sp.]|uniref:hypothetical protein n=1 Tax=Marivirga sp. TaxID=2018662 RepID=UPI0025F5CBC5|nr:hypothetical protein [Marivirga sp.]
MESVIKLSESINSTAEDILPLLSPSGDSLFFARVFHEANNGGKYSGSDIWLSIFDVSTNSWGKASNQLRNWNDKNNNFIIGINSKEQYIYQNNAKNPQKGIQFVKSKSTYWTNPQNISIAGIPNSGYQGIYVSTDYSVILLVMNDKKGVGKEDLYVSTKDNQENWAEPVNLGTTINTSESEISPFLSVDKKTLYFASKGHGGYGDMDIFMSKRLYNNWTVWSKPQNIGKEINSKQFDGYYSEYGDSIAFFSSNREGELSDIYQVNFKKDGKTFNSNRIIPISSTQQKANRTYLNEREISWELDNDKNFMFEMYLNESVNGISKIKEQLGLLAEKLKSQPDLKVAFEIIPLANIPSDVLVIQSNKIMAEIFSLLISKGVNHSNLAYDGIELSNTNLQGDKQKVRIIPSFFR